MIFMYAFILHAQNSVTIKFKLYTKEAPLTVRAFTKILPIKVRAVQARSAGEEIWIPDGPTLKIVPENSTVHLVPGELGIAPVYLRNQAAKSIAIVYGDAKLHDCVNVFAKVYDADVKLLKKLGESIWLNGSQMLEFTLSKK